MDGRVRQSANRTESSPKLIDLIITNRYENAFGAHYTVRLSRHGDTGLPCTAAIRNYFLFALGASSPIVIG